MADGSAPRHAMRGHTGADFLQAEQAKLARFMQMNIHANAAFFRNGENAVQLPGGVAVHLTRVNAAHQFRPRSNGRIQQVEHGLAAGAHHASLGEGHHLHRHRCLMRFPRGQHAFQGRKPEGGGDIGVGADMRRAIRHTTPDQCPGPCGRIQGEGREQRLVSRNPAHAEGLRRMGSPGQAEQSLIQMHMPIHQGGQQQIPIQVQNLPCRGCWGIRRQDSGDPPIL